MQGRCSRIRIGCLALGLVLLIGGAAWLAWRTFHGQTSTKVELTHSGPRCPQAATVNRWRRGSELDHIPHGYFEGSVGTSSFNTEIAPGSSEAG